jgi:hypothetical protein
LSYSDVHIPETNYLHRQSAFKIPLLSSQAKRAACCLNAGLGATP